MSDEAAGAGNTLCISNLAGKIVLFLWNSSIKTCHSERSEAEAEESFFRMYRGKDPSPALGMTAKDEAVIRRRGRIIRVFVKPSQNFPKKFGATPKKGLTIRLQSYIILNVRREPITPAATDREAGISTPFSSLRAYRKGLARAVFRRGDSEGAKRCFRAYTRRSCRNFIRAPDSCVKSASTGKVE